MTPKTEKQKDVTKTHSPLKIFPQLLLYSVSLSLSNGEGRIKGKLCVWVFDNIDYESHNLQISEEKYMYCICDSSGCVQSKMN